MYQRLLLSFAPSIWELDDVKKGVLCQLFGGTMQHSSPDSAESSDGDRNGASQKKDATSSHQRGDINILLCGDPGANEITQSARRLFCST